MRRLANGRVHWLISQRWRRAVLQELEHRQRIDAAIAAGEVVEDEAGRQA